MAAAATVVAMVVATEATAAVAMAVASEAASVAMAMVAATEAAMDVVETVVASDAATAAAVMGGDEGDEGGSGDGWGRMRREHKGLRRRSVLADQWRAGLHAGRLDQHLIGHIPPNCAAELRTV